MKFTMQPITGTLVVLVLIVGGIALWHQLSLQA